MVIKDYNCIRYQEIFVFYFIFSLTIAGSFHERTTQLQEGVRDIRFILEIGEGRDIMREM